MHDLPKVSKVIVTDNFNLSKVKKMKKALGICLAFTLTQRLDFMTEKGILKLLKITSGHIFRIDVSLSF